MLKYSNEILENYSFSILINNFYKIYLRTNFNLIKENYYSYNEFSIIKEFISLTDEQINSTILTNYNNYLEIATLNEENQILKQEIENLKNSLSNSDYQIIKCSESFMLGAVLPYDFSHLLAERTEIRNKINNLEKGIAISETTILEQEKSKKIIEMSAIAQTTIMNGVDCNNEHYRLNTTDQINIMSMYTLAQTGANVPYHSDGNVCKIYAPTEMIALVQKCMSWITYHTTYFNLLKHQILEYTTLEEVNSVNYGMPLKEEYQTIINTITGGGSN